MPKLSVVIATYNRPQLLRETLQSIHKQQYRDFGIVVVDDASTTPGVEAVCDEFPECRYIHQAHGGRSQARNRGIEASDSELVAFVDDDDVWKPSKLTRQIAFLADNPTCGLVHCPVEVIDEHSSKTGQVLGARAPEQRHGQVFKHAVRSCIVRSPTPIVRRSILEQTGTFDTELNGPEDMELWARIAYVTTFGFIEEPLAFYRIHSASHTAGADYLDAAPYIAQKLCGIVRQPDRSVVKRGTATHYLHAVGKHTEANSDERRTHMQRVAKIWPPIIFTRTYAGLWLGRDKKS